MFQTPQYQKVIKYAKPLLILVLTVFIFYKLFYAYHINTRLENFDINQNHGSYLFLMCAFGLMFFNWGLESVKWRKLIVKFEPIGMRVAIKAVLSGVTLSIITPNQIGDFAGRVIHLELMNKIRGSLVTVIGHAAQVIITLFFGAVSLSFFSIHFAGIWYWIPLAAVLILISLSVFLNLKWAYSKAIKIPWIHQFEKYADVFGQFTQKELFEVLLISLLRYLVFLFQYYFLLQFFKVDIAFFPAIACIIGTFCVQSVVPSFLILDIGLRGASAVAFFSLFSGNQEGILLAAYSLWIVNMLIPALLGMYFIYRVKS